MDLDTARTLTLIAMIFQLLSTILGVFFLFLFFLLLGLSRPLPAMFQAVATVQLQVPLLFLVPLVFLTGLGFIPLVLLVLTYFLVYRRLSEDRVGRALGPALGIAIASLVLGGIISGILLIVAYVKAKDAQTKILYART
jgi:hypothetical protein